MGSGSHNPAFVCVEGSYFMVLGAGGRGRGGRFQPSWLVGEGQSVSALKNQHKFVLVRGLVPCM